MEQTKKELFNKLNQIYKEGKMTSSFFQEIDALSEQIKEHKYTLYLEYLKSALPILKDKYIKEGIPLDIYEATIKDLDYKKTECQLVYGINGIFPFSWYVGLFNLEILAFGRLQFQILTLYEDIDKENVHLKKGERVINIHIPRDGTKLDYERVKESYRLASKFYIEHYGFTYPIPFMLESWLMDPIIKEFLPLTSNIVKFTSDFVLFKSSVSPSYDEIWRLFDKKYEGDFDTLPADSTLRRKYIESFKKGRGFGRGEGIYIYNKIKF